MVSKVVLPTLVVTVRRGFPSDDALLGISFRTMATVLSAALESFPYNSEIIASGQLDNSVLFNPQPPPCPHPRPGHPAEKTSSLKHCDWSSWMTLHRVMPFPQDYGNEERFTEQCGGLIVDSDEYGCPQHGNLILMANYDVQLYAQIIFSRSTAITQQMTDER